MSLNLQVNGRIDGAGRLTTADPRLAALHASAGGEMGGVLAIPQIASIARLARQLGIVVSRPAIAAEGDMDLELWVRAQPEGEDVALAITGWKLREPQGPAISQETERETDFRRAEADWTWQTDDQLNFTSLSPALAAAAGRTEGELIGKQLTQLFRFKEDEDGSLAILSALAGQRDFEGQHAELRGRGKQICLLKGVPIFDEEGKFAGFQGVAAETIKAVGNQPSQLGKPIEGGVFARRLEEALRRPLEEIIEQAQSIGSQGEGPLRHDYAGYARDISLAGGHLMELVDDLVDLEAIERPDFKPQVEELDLGQLAQRAAALLSVRASVRGVAIEVPPTTHGARGMGDSRRTMQIVMNLLSNALRHSPEGGVVSIAMGVDGATARLKVIDQGEGIAQSDQERIFEKFERLDSSESAGTGLGLYIARRLAEAMHGSLSVESAPGAGSTFTLALPAAG